MYTNCFLQVVFPCARICHTGHLVYRLFQLLTILEYAQSIVESSLIHCHTCGFFSIPHQNEQCNYVNSEEAILSKESGRLHQEATTLSQTQCRRQCSPDPQMGKALCSTNISSFLSLELESTGSCRSGKNCTNQVCRLCERVLPEDAEARGVPN